VRDRLAVHDSLEIGASQRAVRALERPPPRDAIAFCDNLVDGAFERGAELRAGASGAFGEERRVEIAADQRSREVPSQIDASQRRAKSIAIV
jgi:hypothetical protein